MPFYEREEKILGILSINDITSVDEIAEKLFITERAISSPENYHLVVTVTKKDI
mgnify:CR=1 FL=1